MPTLIFRFNEESKSLKKTLTKGPKLCTEQSFKKFACFSSLMNTTNEYSMRSTKLSTNTSNTLRSLVQRRWISHYLITNIPEPGSQPSSSPQLLSSAWMPFRSTSVTLDPISSDPHSHSTSAIPVRSHTVNWGLRKCTVTRISQVQYSGQPPLLPP